MKISFYLNSRLSYSWDIKRIFPGVFAQLFTHANGYTHNCFDMERKVDEWKGLISAKKLDITKNIYCVTILGFSWENGRMIHN